MEKAIVGTSEGGNVLIAFGLAGAVGLAVAASRAIAGDLLGGNKSRSPATLVQTAGR